MLVIEQLHIITTSPFSPELLLDDHTWPSVIVVWLSGRYHRPGFAIVCVFTVLFYIAKVIP